MKEGMQRIVGDPCLPDTSCYKLVGRSVGGGGGGGGGGSILYMREMVIGLLELSFVYTFCKQNGGRSKSALEHVWM